MFLWYETNSLFGRKYESINMTGFAWPLLFLLLPLPWLVRKFAGSPAKEGGEALKIPFFRDIAGLKSRKGSVLSSSGKGRLVFLSILWILLVCAAARPQWVGDVVPATENVLNLIMAIDISGSMSMDDFELNGKYLDRLSVVKAVADSFIAGREGDRIGLVAFGTNSYLYVPLTADTDTARKMLDELEIGFAGQLTSIGDALGLSLKSMQEIPSDSKVIILLSDGTSNSGNLNVEQAINLARKMKVKIYTIGVGAYIKSIRTPFGTQKTNPSKELDEENLQKIATSTGGEYFRAYNTSELQRIYQKIDELEPSEIGSFYIRPVRELFFFPLGAALLLSMLAVLFALAEARKS